MGPFHQRCRGRERDEPAATPLAPAIYTGDFDAIFLIARYGINPYPYSGFYAPGAILGILNKGSGVWIRAGRAFGPRASLDRRRQIALQATLYKYGSIVRHQITVFLISTHR